MTLFIILEWVLNKSYFSLFYAETLDYVMKSFNSYSQSSGIGILRLLASLLILLWSDHLQFPDVLPKRMGLRWYTVHQECNDLGWVSTWLHSYLHSVFLSSEPAFLTAVTYLLLLFYKIWAVFICTVFKACVAYPYAFKTFFFFMSIHFLLQQTQLLCLKAGTISCISVFLALCPLNIKKKLLNNHVTEWPTSMKRLILGMIHDVKMKIIRV